VTPAVDWARPWLAPLRPWAQRLPGGLQAADALDALAPPGGPRFVRQGAMAAGEPYEAFIARRGEVPTRDNLHDLFNGLVWLCQPALKRRLNQLQAGEIATRGVGPERGALRDALTLFDEFGAFWPAPPAALRAALLARDWQALFVTHRAAWARHEPVIVGHALLEQLAVAPRKGLTAHVALGDPLAWTADEWARKPFVPLPVLGIPGWWPDNEDPSFYGDKRVFRPSRA
jgi:Protein of unknown function (DUF3025)